MRTKKPYVLGQSVFPFTATFRAVGSRGAQAHCSKTSESGKQPQVCDGIRHHRLSVSDLAIAHTGPHTLVIPIFVHVAIYILWPLYGKQMHGGGNTGVGI